MFISILSDVNKFYPYKVTVMVLICFVFSSWITNDFWRADNQRGAAELDIAHRQQGQVVELF